MSYVRGIYLVARREYLAYVGAWGFWISLISTPLLLAMVIFVPVVLRQAEPTRYLAVLADRADEGRAVTAAFEQDERDNVRDALNAYAQRAAPKGADAALHAFDAQGDVNAATQAARAVLDDAAPAAGARFKPPPARYQVVLAPAPDIDGLKPYLSGAETIGGEPLFGVFVVHGSGEARASIIGAPISPIKRRGARARCAGCADAERGAQGARAGADGSGADTRLVARVRAIRSAAARGRRGGDEQRPRAVRCGDRAGALIVEFGHRRGEHAADGRDRGKVEQDPRCADDEHFAVADFDGQADRRRWRQHDAVFGVGSGRRCGPHPSRRISPRAASLARWRMRRSNPGLLATFLVCFAAGYLMYGALFLGIGSLCESLQESQTLLGPIFLVMIGPVLLLGPAFENPKSPLIAAASWIPPFTPFLMLMRAPAGLSLGETIGPVLLLIATLAGVLVISARVFRAGISNQLKIGDLFRRRQRQTG